MKRPDREPDYVFMHQKQPWSYFWFEEMCTNRASVSRPIELLYYVNGKLSSSATDGAYVNAIQDAYQEWLADKAIEEYILR